MTLLIEGIQYHSWGISPYINHNIKRVSTLCCISWILRHCCASNSTPSLRWITRLNIQWPSRQRLWNVGGGFVPQPKDATHSFRCNNNNNNTPHEDDSDSSVRVFVTLVIELAQVGQQQLGDSQNLTIVTDVIVSACQQTRKLTPPLHAYTTFVWLPTQ